MKFPKLIQGTFINRPNRFLGEVEVDGQTVIAHVPNTGRLKELLYPGNTVYLSYHDSPKRKTKYELILAMKGDQVVSVDSQMPNKVMYDALVNRKDLFNFNEEDVKREVKYLDSRFDLFINNNQPIFIEVKGVTLVNDGYAMFPDAPTTRGLKHVREMIHAKSEGYEGMIVFLVQLSPVKGFKPHTIRQPEFTESLIKAKSVGIQIVAYECSVDFDGIEIIGEVPVILED